MKDVAKCKSQKKKINIVLFYDSKNKIKIKENLINMKSMNERLL
jgi:hypothetical protein